LFGLPLYHLDQYYSKPNWTRSTTEEFSAIHADICNSQAWIMERLYMRWLEPRFASADTIIFLDIPRRVCMWRVIKRMITNYGQDIPVNPKNCPQKVSGEFLSWVWNFNARYRNMLLEMLDIHKTTKKIFIIRCSADIATLLSEL
jgi:adenylate kinase family enzyme